MTNYTQLMGIISVVERLVANEKVEGSTPFARSKMDDKICVEGWRGINLHTMVNQRQLIELSKYPIELKHKDISFFNKNWNENKIVMVFQ